MKCSICGKTVSEFATVNKNYHNGVYSKTDWQILNDLMTYGNAFEYVYLDEKNNIRSKVFRNQDAYPIYDDSLNYRYFVEYWKNKKGGEEHFVIYYPTHIDTYYNGRLIESKTNFKRLHNLIEMRADGEITREVFKMKQDEIEKRLAEIDKELEQLNPDTVDEAEEATHEEKITILRYYLEQSLKPSIEEDIPEDVIRAFVKKIVAHTDGFDWYLRFSPDDDPEKLGIEGRRKDSAKVSSLCSMQHRPLLDLGRTNLYFSFTITFEEAERYRKSTDQYLRAKQWEDLTVEVFI